MENVQGSHASHPDLDWSQIRETVLMLELSVAQIESAMKDSDGSVGVLADSFTTMMDTIRQIDDEARALPEEGWVGELRAKLQGQCGQVIQQMQTVIIAFQFYDKLTQRLDHAARSIDNLAGIISSPASLYNPEEWRKLQELIRSKYTMEEERQMFDAIMRGLSVNQALAIFHTAVQARKKQEEGSIDLF